MNFKDIIHPKYTYKNKEYWIESYCTMKNPQTREWEKAVVYLSCESGERYVRLESEWLERFKNVSGAE